MPANLDVQVYVEDVEEQKEMALDCWKVTHNFYHRLQHQGAPPYLLEKLSEIIHGFATAHAALEQISGYFPPMDGRPAD